MSPCRPITADNPPAPYRWFRDHHINDPPISGSRVRRVTQPCAHGAIRRVTVGHGGVRTPINSVSTLFLPPLPTSHRGDLDSISRGHDAKVRSRKWTDGVDAVHFPPHVRHGCWPTGLDLHTPWCRPTTIGRRVRSVALTHLRMMSCRTPVAVLFPPVRADARTAVYRRPLLWCYQHARRRSARDDALWCSSGSPCNPPSCVVSDQRPRRTSTGIPGQYGSATCRPMLELMWSGVWVLPEAQMVFAEV